MNDNQIIETFQKIKRIKTIKETADMLGINPSFISNIKRGKEKIPEKVIVEMARLAGPKITEAWGERCKERIREQL